ncbi:NAD-dependent deacylase [Aquimarina sp. ERC-38]|uniref:SIR2 family NAD-dependent protein deacylase n=1 Tax=Aquimarina sp. ERC-38 TaxID=2949996 RepID=UPI002246287F|nr:NAD-dependent deacylase [Aquimarina sp. ERC-38]UZO80759.1 NAD-dependent deacylase [Aquimarina sp. ERC-38]
MKNIVVLTGAGISAESGIKTFRDADGLWEGYDVMEVASPQGWQKNPKLVLQFYNDRRRQLSEVHPNAAHKALVQLEEQYHVTIITQNVDDLHERAGSSHVVHLHGELLKARSQKNPDEVIPCTNDINYGDTCKYGQQLRPHIVWFGEEVPMLETAISLTEKADILIIIGTSMQVYPAANLVHYVTPGIPKYFVDPAPAITDKSIQVIAKKASLGVPELVTKLLEHV